MVHYKAVVYIFPFQSAEGLIFVHLGILYTVYFYVFTLTILVYSTITVTVTVKK